MQNLAVLSSSVAALAGVVAAVVAFRALSDTHETSRRQLRAYLLLEDPQLKPIPVSEGVAPVVVRFKNYGQTPALSAKGEGWIDILPWPMPPYDRLPRPPVPMVKEIEGTAIGQGDSGGWLAKAYRPFSAADLEALRRGKTKVYVYGDVTYRDVFGRTHTTHYCLTHDEFGGPVGGMDCPYGNFID